MDWEVAKGTTFCIVRHRQASTLVPLETTFTKEGQLLNAERPDFCGDWYGGLRSERASFRSTKVQKCESVKLVGQGGEIPKAESEGLIKCTAKPNDGKVIKINAKKENVGLR